MAHVAKNDLHVRPAVAGADIVEGLLVRLTASGASDLPIALPAASTSHLNVYVAFFPPDNFSRPTPVGMYKANWYGVSDSNTGWSTQINESQYLVGPSVTENPVVASGMKLQARRGGIYHVANGVVVESASAKVVGNLVKVAADGSGKWEYTATEADAIGKVVDYSPEAGVYTFELGFDS